MKMYVEVDNRLVKWEDKKTTNKNDKEKKENNSNNQTIAESYGLSKNARILTE